MTLMRLIKVISGCHSARSLLEGGDPYARRFVSRSSWHQKEDLIFFKKQESLDHPLGVCQQWSEAIRCKNQIWYTGTVIGSVWAILQAFHMVIEVLKTLRSSSLKMNLHVCVCVCLCRGGHGGRGGHVNDHGGRGGHVNDLYNDLFILVTILMTSLYWWPY